MGIRYICSCIPATFSCGFRLSKNVGYCLWYSVSGCRLTSLMFLVQGTISMLGMIIGIALISLDHLNKDDDTYLTVGVGMTSSLIGYWLPEPRAPGKKRKKKNEDIRSDKNCQVPLQIQNNTTIGSSSKDFGSTPSLRNGRVPSRVNKIRKKLDTPEFNAGINLGKNILSGVKDEVEKEQQMRSDAGLTTVNIKIDTSINSGKRCGVSIGCFNPFKKCYSCIRSRKSWISKKNGKLLLFIVRSILSILGMIAGIVLIVLDKLNDQKGPYLTVGIALVSSIIGYWLPSPNQPQKSKNRKKPISKKKLRKAKREAKVLRKNVNRRKRSPPDPENMV